MSWLVALRKTYKYEVNPRFGRVVDLGQAVQATNALGASSAPIGEGRPRSAEKSPSAARRGDGRRGKKMRSLYWSLVDILRRLGRPS